MPAATEGVTGFAAEALGVKTAAAAALGDIPSLLATAVLLFVKAGPSGVNDGESTFKKAFWKSAFEPETCRALSSFEESC